MFLLHKTLLSNLLMPANPLLSRNINIIECLMTQLSADVLIFRYHSPQACAPFRALCFPKRNLHTQHLRSNTGDRALVRNTDLIQLLRLRNNTGIILVRSANAPRNTNVQLQYLAPVVLLCLRSVALSPFFGLTSIVSSSKPSKPGFRSRNPMGQQTIQGAVHPKALDYLIEAQQTSYGDTMSATAGSLISSVM